MASARIKGIVRKSLGAALIIVAMLSGILTWLDMLFMGTTNVAIWSSAICVVSLALAYKLYSGGKRERQVKQESKRAKEFPHDGKEGFHFVYEAALLVASVLCLLVIAALIMLLPGGARLYAWLLLAVCYLAAFRWYRKYDQQEERQREKIESSA